MIRARMKILLPAMLMLVLTLSGCQSVDNSVDNSENNGYDESLPQTGEMTEIIGNGTTVVIDGNGAKESDGIIRISNAGDYMLQGEFQNFQVLIDAGKEDVVQLYLNGATMTNENYSLITGISSKQIIITLVEETVNELSDGNEYRKQSDDDEINSVIFSKDDITINGNGTLILHANYEDAIRSKDTLEILSGTYEVYAKNDGFQGKDELKIVSGNFNVEVGNDAFKASNSSDEGKGNLVIEEGNFTVSAGDDAFHAENTLTVNGGMIYVTKCYEGLEGIEVTINGGEIAIQASDDGINAAGGSDEGEDFFGKGGFEAQDENAKITINDGYIYVNAEGDGIDSNGTIEINGGTVLIDGPTNNGNAALDYALNATVNGGSVIAVGSAGMAVGFSQESEQYSWNYQADSMQNEKTLFTIVSESGEVLASYQPSKGYQSVVVSLPEFTLGSTYRIVLGGVSKEADEHGFSKQADISEGKVAGSVVIEDKVNGNASNEGGFMPRGGMGEGRTEKEMPEGMEPHEGKERPEGMEPPEGMERPKEKIKNMEQDL